MYDCVNNVLTLLPALDGAQPFTLTASNPTIAVDGWPITANGLHLWIGGTTASFCPDQVGSACPPGNITALFAGSNSGAAMDVMVPGGQAVYLDPYWNVGYTIAHSGQIPPGSLTTGFSAYQNGGFVNLNSWGWVACPPTASGGGGNNGAWNLVAKNETNAPNLGGCYGVNLKVNTLPRNTYGAWEYT